MDGTSPVGGENPQGYDEDELVLRERIFHEGDRGGGQGGREEQDCDDDYAYAEAEGGREGVGEDDGGDGGGDDEMTVTANWGLNIRDVRSPGQVAPSFNRCDLRVLNRDTKSVRASNVSFS